MPRESASKARGRGRSTSQVLTGSSTPLIAIGASRPDLEPAAYLSPGLAADAQAAGRRGLLHASRDVHRDAADAALGVDAAAEQHTAGVDADAHVEAGVAVPPQHLRPFAPALLEQGEAGEHRPFRVVLLGALGAEHRQQAVAGVLQDLAAVGRDDRGAAGEQAVDHRLQVLGIELAGERGRADDVEEQHADMGEAGRSAAGSRWSDASSARSGAIAASTTASPSAARCVSREAIADSIRCVRSSMHRIVERALAPGSGPGRRRRRPAAS